MTDKNAWIFDIDGTIANGTHRQHHMKKKPKNWVAYQKLGHLDAVYLPVKEVFHALWQKNNAKIFICSGRNEDEREMTTKWLFDHCDISVSEYKSDDNSVIELLMRKAGDYRRDDIIKIEIYENNILSRGYNVIGVFDDRQRVVKAWRDAGLYVFHVDQTSVSEDF